jgi:subtilisin family serine protease
MFGTSSPTRARGRGWASTCAVVAVAGAAVLTPGLSASAAPSASAAKGASATAQYVAGELMNYAINVTTANRGQTLKVERAVEAAGGSVIESYPEIGVVIAQSDNVAFAKALRSEKAVASVGATRTAAVTATDPTFGVHDPLAPGESGKGKDARKNTAAPSIESTTTLTPDPLETQQWDMALIGATQAHEITDGSRDVLVAVLDSGIQGDHPDLAANVDASASADCNSGVPNTSYAAWQPTTSDHGTHVAGTIAAARNGVGIVGVAPNVRLSSVKVVNDDGFIYPEAAICGFMYATATGADVTNNSYYIDPWQFWCDDDADQAAVKTAVDRAVQYSQQKGLVNVAAAGNSNVDLANKTIDTSSPNDTTPVERQLNAGCEDIPAELDGVVTVSSTTQAGERSSFSNYGLGVIDVAAPGSRILSTVTGGGYGLKSGTSMASPHVAGVAALLKSAQPSTSGAALVTLLTEQANDVPCPAVAGTCVGTADDNGYFGEGLVDALEAVS